MKVFNKLIPLWSPPSGSQRANYAFLVLILPILLLTACASFKSISLSDEALPPTPSPVEEQKLSYYVETQIYEDDVTNVWGIENDSCKSAQVLNSQGIDGSTALQIKWDRYDPKCDWIGFGIGWDDWIGKDLSDLVNRAAIQMNVRAVEGQMFGLPVVLSLEDYSNAATYSYTLNKFFERTSIDENWQKVTVPLSSFSEGNGNPPVDLTNIKQLQLELQQAGHVMFDKISLVEYTPEPLIPWVKEEKLPNPNSWPITLFDDAFINNNGFGMMEDACRNIKISSGDAKSGSKALDVKWDKKDETCYNLEFGISWNKWNPVDMTPMNQWTNATVQFDVKNEGSGNLTDVPVTVYFQDYSYRRAIAKIKSNYIKGGSIGSEWTTVTIPVTSFKGNADWTDIKALNFLLEKQGHLRFDNIKLVK